MEISPSRKGSEEGSTASRRRLSDRLREKFGGNVPKDVEREMVDVDLCGFMALRIRQIVDRDREVIRTQRHKDPDGFLGNANFVVAKMLGEVVWKWGGNEKAHEMMEKIHSELCAEIRKKRGELVTKYGLAG